MACTSVEKQAGFAGLTGAGDAGVPRANGGALDWQTVDQLEVARPEAPMARLDQGVARGRGAHVGAGEADRAGLDGQAKRALIALGWSKAIATAAVSAAAARRREGQPRVELDPDGALERLIFEALRSCPTQGLQGKRPANDGGG